MDRYDLYEKLPGSLQTIAVSARGLSIRRSRYGAEFRTYTRKAISRQWQTQERWRELQAERLETLLTYARQHVPYYRSALSGVDLSPLKTKDGAGIKAVLRQIPLTEKEPIRSDPEDYRSEEIEEMETVHLRTSGTTGTPMRIVQSAESHRILHATKERFWRWCGVRHGDRRLSFTGNRIVPPQDDEGPFGRTDLANNRRLMSVYHLGEETVDQYLEEICSFDPDFIDGYPSAMEVCARRAIESGFELEVPAAFPTAETLRPDQREVIERGFGTRVYNQYGSIEGAALITECPAGTLHVNPEVGIVELREDGNTDGPVEMVLTGLNNRAMPFIRYRIGDMAVPSKEEAACPCGRDMPRVGEIVGRQDDVVVTADGRRIGMLSYNVFKWADHVQESQIIQHTPQRFELKIVPAESFDESEETLLIEKLTDRVGDDIEIETTLVDAIDRTGQGKLRSVISHVTND